MDRLLGFSRFMDSASERVGRMVSWLILFAVLISAGNAIIRKTFDIGSNAFLELQWYLFGAVFLLGAAWTLKRNEHIRIDVVVGRFSARAHAWIDIFGTVFFLLPLCFIVLYNGIPFAFDSLKSGEMSSNAGGLIVWPAKMLIPMGFLLLALQGFSELIKRVAFLQGRIDGSDFEKAGHHGIDEEDIKREIEAIAAANKISVDALGVEQPKK